MANPNKDDKGQAVAVPEKGSDAPVEAQEDSPKPLSDTERIDALYASLHGGNVWPPPGYDTDGRKLPEDDSE